jgi:nitroreductase/NAD-dependent dihydropyrimidine dehydrogenase PreA subunit
MITIDQKKCTQCDMCVGHCPAEIITEGPEIKEAIHKYCVGCGHCAVACPTGAISVVGLEDVKIPPYSKEVPISCEAMETLLRKRRSVRHYKPEPVSKEHLKNIIEAASLVPTAHNWRPFKAYVCTDHTVISDIHKRVTEHYTRFIEVLKKPVEGMPEPMRHELLFAFDRLVVNPSAGRDSLFWKANTLLVFTTRIHHPLCIGDAWMASFAAVMYAETIPVGTCYNGFLIMALNEDPSIKPFLKIPDEELVVSGFTLGYSDEKHFSYPPRRVMETEWI